MTRWPLIVRRLLLLVVAATVLAACTAHAHTSQPNIVFILADDLGWRDMSIEGSRFYQTPRIDSIAAQGLRFTRGYAACQVCSPSRAAIMLGQYPARIGITDYIGARAGQEWTRNTRLLPAKYKHALPSEPTTLAEALRSGGYRTFFAGKWHLGGEGSLPTDHGFEFNIGGHHRGSPPGGYFSPYENPQMEDGPVGELLPQRLAEETSRFIESHSDEPFFAFLSFYSVHSPIQTTEALWNKYRDIAAQLPAPQSRFLIDPTLPVRQVQDHPIYAGMMESMDAAVGHVLDTLSRLGLEENTIVIFTSDNGGVSAGDGYSTANLPLRGGKGRQWEGGLRAPFYIKWPDAIAAGSESSTLASGIDFLPTLLELTGLPVPEDQTIDGQSLVPAIHGRTDRQRDLFWHYPHYGNQGGEPSSIIRSGDWKLIRYHEDGRRELYNVTDDPGERRDQARNYLGLVRQLDARLHFWLDAIGVSWPTPNPAFDPIAHAEGQEEIRHELLPRLESTHANFLDPSWQPSRGWWETDGRRR